VGQSLFSQYSQGENRVTASILAVLKSLAIPRTERLLQSLVGDTSSEFFRFSNQPSGNAGSVPDARISANFRIDIETKVRTDSVKEAQIRNHLSGLKKAKESTRLLILLTPDRTEPKVMGDFLGKPVMWRSFSELDSAIDELLEDSTEVVSEREAFLLRELQQMFHAEKLLKPANNVLVVPARNAWPEYLEYHAYICQPNRTFQDVDYLAFYADGEIKPKVAKILEVEEEVVIAPDRVPRTEFRQLVEKLVANKARETGATNKILLLSSPDEESTVDLDRAVPNNLTTNNVSGRTVAFTQNQRYVSMENLKEAKNTKDLVDTN
jgi:hypothetical protein